MPAFMTLSSNWPRHPTFYRITAGSNPARVAIFRSCSPTAEARRRERRQCGCESCHEHPCPGLKLRQRSNRLLTGSAGCMSLQAHHSSKVVRTVPCAAHRQHPSSDLSPEATKSLADGFRKVTRNLRDTAQRTVRTTLRPLVKQHHVWLTSRNRRRTSFTGDLLPLNTPCETRLRRRGAEEQRGKVSISASLPLCPPD